MTDTVNQYDRGQLIRLVGEVRNEGGSLVCPSLAAFSVLLPGASAAQATAPTPTTVGSGTFHAFVDATADGEWRYRFIATGLHQAAAEHTFLVRRSYF